MTRPVVLVLVLVLVARVASADVAGAVDDPCTTSLTDPTITSLRDADLDAQRSACVRQDVSGRVLAHALVDTPGFHGDLGGELVLAGRMILHRDYEASVQLHLIDFTFVQNAVNMATNTAFGPIVVGGARTTRLAERTRGALAAQLELPYTGDPLETFHVGGSLTALVAHRLAPHLVLHGRLGGHGMHASSVAGSTNRAAIRAGADVAWQLSRCLAVQAGTELSAGWYHGFDHVLLRAGVHWQMHATDWRLRAGLGAPLGGDERTNAVLDVAVLRGL
jgi:hypothetical protein